MSTFYATFSNWKQARSAVDEFVNGGVSPDDLSLVVCKKGALDGEAHPIREYATTVGDATAFVGRKDDPTRNIAPPPHVDITNYAATEMSRLSPVDTSNSDTDVDSVDQMEDSQSEMEAMMSPHDGVSNSAHEKDDLALTVLTGFPTAASNFSEDTWDPFLEAEQNSDGLETIVIPGVGVVIGGGALATAALDFVSGDEHCGSESLVAQLIDEGVPHEMAKDFQRHFASGDAILAIAVTPGILNEGAVEEIASRNGAENGELYDAPRY